MQRDRPDDRYPPAPSPVHQVRRIAGAVLVAVAAITAAAAVTDTDEVPHRVTAAGAGTPGARRGADDPVGRALAGQAAALLRGDPRAWLAAVDPVKPALRKRYQGVYRALRGLRISHFEYHLAPDTPAAGDEVTVDVQVTFCFSQDPCPAYVPDNPDGPPRIAQTLTLRAAGKGYVITALATAERPTGLQPTPWETGELVVAEGRRVSVGAPPELAGRLPEAVRVADLAAAVDDRYAALIGNPQRRYRVFLASPKTWKTWYAAGVDDWAAGYMQPLNGVAADVVIDMSAIRDRAGLREVIQHELGHVATVGGVNPPDHWLVEGIAEYIGMRPRPAAATYSRTVLRRMARPTSIVPKPLGAGGRHKTGR